MLNQIISELLGMHKMGQISVNNPAAMALAKKYYHFIDEEIAKQAPKKQANYTLEQQFSDKRDQDGKKSEDVRADVFTIIHDIFWRQYFSQLPDNIVREYIIVVINSFLALQDEAQLCETDDDVLRAGGSIQKTTIALDNFVHENPNLPQNKLPLNYSPGDDNPSVKMLIDFLQKVKGSTSIWYSNRFRSDIKGKTFAAIEKTLKNRVKYSIIPCEQLFYLERIIACALFVRGWKSRVQILNTKTNSGQMALKLLYLTQYCILKNILLENIRKDSLLLYPGNTTTGLITYKDLQQFAKDFEPYMPHTDPMFG